MLEEWQTDNDFKRNATSYLFCFFCLKTSLIRKPLWMFTAALFLYFLSLLYVTFVLYNDTATHQMRKVLKSIKNKSQENKAWGMCCDTTYRILTQRFRTPAKIQFWAFPEWKAMSPAHVVTEAYAVTTAISAHVWTPKSDYLQIIMQMVCLKDKDEEVSSFITCLATNIKRCNMSEF